MSQIAVVIPHYSGGTVLRRCLYSLRRSVYRDFYIVLVDNGCTDGSVAEAKKTFPEIRIVKSAVNLGFAGGCNLGMRSSKSPYVVLLNDDTEVDPGWLEPLVRSAEADPRIGAVQPKLLSLRDKRRFDYAGAAGGEMDLFGYPFARGRLFETVEEDCGQYDAKSRTIFWASGAAVLFRTAALKKVGLLDEAFFAHMEEIDLDFRLHWAGYQIVYQPESIVYHQTGGTLGEEHIRKKVLNHRNSLVMLLKNHTAATLCWLYPARLFLEALTFGVSVLRRDWTRAAAIPMGLIGVLKCRRTVLTGRKQVASIRTVPEDQLLHQLYRGSAAVAYFLFGKHRAHELLGD